MARDPTTANPAKYTSAVGSNTVEYDAVASRRLLKLALDDEIKGCRRCDGLNIDGFTASAPGYGCLTSPVALVGQSLCEKCMETQIPFTEGSGDLVDEGIKRAGREKKNSSSATRCTATRRRTARPISTRSSTALRTCTANLRSSGRGW